MFFFVILSFFLYLLYSWPKIKNTGNHAIPNQTKPKSPKETKVVCPDSHAACRNWGRVFRGEGPIGVHCWGHHHWQPQQQHREWLWWGYGGCSDILHISSISNINLQVKIVFRRKWFYHLITIFIQSVLLLGVAYMTFYFRINNFQVLFVNTESRGLLFRSFW